MGFQSTLPVGEATQVFFYYREKFAISIHASRGGSDWRVDAASRRAEDFNPRFPWGKRPSEEGFRCL